MVKLILKPLTDGDKDVVLEKGKTTLGRGTLLSCADKKVSRNAATLELKEDGEVVLTSTHVNPVFFGSNDASELKPLKTNKTAKLKDSDVFSLTPGGFKFQVKLEGVESNGNGNDADLNGNGETKAKESKAAKQEDSEAESEQEEKPKKAAKKQQESDDYVEEEEEDDDEEFNEDSDEESEADEKPKKAKKEKVNSSRSGRAARTAAVKKKPTYVEEPFDDSDEEWIDSESEDERAVKKAKSRGKKKAASDSESDWEAEYKGKGRGSRRRAASSDEDEESGSDWERSTSRKPARKSKPVKRTPASRKSARGRSKKKFTESEEDEQMELSDAPEEKVERKMCKKNCGRKNPSHLKQFAHPGDADFVKNDDEESAEEPEDEDVESESERKPVRGKRAAAAVKSKYVDPSESEGLSEEEFEERPAKRPKKAESGSDFDEEDDEDFDELKREAKKFVKSKA